MEEIGSPSAEKTLFKKLYWTAQGFGVLAVGLILGITFRYLGGVGWGTDLALQFHWHPILMVTGMIFLYGNCKLNPYAMRSVSWSISINPLPPQPFSSTEASVTPARRT